VFHSVKEEIMGVFDWIRPSRKPTSANSPDSSPSKPGTTFTLVEGSFDPDGDKSDLVWSGFHIHDARGVGMDYDDAEKAFNLTIFRVAGVSYRSDPLQRSEFEPGSVLKLVAEENNPHDRNAVSVWDRWGTNMIGYVPRERNEWVRAAMQIPGTNALALAEHRKDGKRVSLTVVFGPIAVKS